MTDFDDLSSSSSPPLNGPNCMENYSWQGLNWDSKKGPANEWINIVQRGHKEREGETGQGITNGHRTGCDYKWASFSSDPNKFRVNKTITLQSRQWPNPSPSMNPYNLESGYQMDGTGRDGPLFQRREFEWFIKSIRAGRGRGPKGGRWDPILIHCDLISGQYFNTDISFTSPQMGFPPETSLFT